MSDVGTALWASPTDASSCAPPAQHGWINCDTGVASVTPHNCIHQTTWMHTQTYCHSQCASSRLPVMPLKRPHIGSLVASPRALLRIPSTTPSPIRCPAYQQPIAACASSRLPAMPLKRHHIGFLVASPRALLRIPSTPTPIRCPANQQPVAACFDE